MLLTLILVLKLKLKRKSCANTQVDKVVAQADEDLEVLEVSIGGVGWQGSSCC